MITFYIKSWPSPRADGIDALVSGLQACQSIAAWRTHVKKIFCPFDLFDPSFGRMFWQNEHKKYLWLCIGSKTFKMVWLYPSMYILTYFTISGCSRSVVEPVQCVPHLLTLPASASSPYIPWAEGWKLGMVEPVCFTFPHQGMGVAGTLIFPKNSSHLGIKLINWIDLRIEGWWNSKLAETYCQHAAASAAETNTSPMGQLDQPASDLGMDCESEELRSSDSWQSRILTRPAWKLAVKLPPNQRLAGLTLPAYRSHSSPWRSSGQWPQGLHFWQWCLGCWLQA